MRRAATILLAGALTLVACGGDDDDDATLDVLIAPSVAPTTTAVPPAPTTTSTSTTTTSVATTTVAPPPPPPTPPPLPVPVAAPPEDGTREDTFEVGFLEIPALGLATPMLEGIRLSTLDRDPGHWPGTALPGELGNVVVAAHRTTHDAEFRHLDQLDPGDEVIMSTFAGRFVYRVLAVEVVAPDALWIVEQTNAHRATLFACHPPGSVRQRIVAHLELTV